MDAMAVATRPVPGDHPGVLDPVAGDTGSGRLTRLVTGPHVAIDAALVTPHPPGRGRAVAMTGRAGDDPTSAGSLDRIVARCEGLAGAPGAIGTIDAIDAIGATRRMGRMAVHAAGGAVVKGSIAGRRGVA